MEWLAANWSTVLEIGLSVLGVASMIARITPTQADDNVLNAILKVVHTFGLTKPPPKA